MQTNTTVIIAGRKMNRQEPTEQERAQQFLLDHATFGEFIFSGGNLQDILGKLFTSDPENKIRQLGGEEAAFAWAQKQVSRWR